MSNSPIDIDALKSGANNTPGPDQIVDPNLEKNIDGKEVRDFGNGLKEFDPAANGFKPEEIDRGMGDDEKALAQLDEVLAEKEKEVQIFNELQEMNNGVVSEEELREALDQGYITKDLKDGNGGKFEENPGKKAPAETTPASVEKPKTSEIDDLEAELADDDADEPAPKVKEQPHHTEIKPQKPIQANVSNPSPIINFDERKESVVDDDGLSQEDKDLAALDSPTPQVDDTEDFETKLKRELRKKLNPITKKFDLSSAEVIRKPASVNNYVNRKQKITKRSFIWPLFNSNRPIQIQSFNATELNVLSGQARNANATLDVFKTIYAHIVSPKGADFEQWAKSTSYYDINHIWFAIYGACFYDSIYLPFTCDKCNDITVTKEVSLMEMVKFENDEAKKRFEKIMDMPVDESFGSVFAESRVQISDDIVVGFKEPSLYTSIVEDSYYDRDFREKYSDIIGLISYISDIYYITDEGQLEVFETKKFPNNAVKTAKAKVIQYAKLLRSLTSDEYGLVMSTIIEMSRHTDMVSYQMPEITCEKCGAIIPAETQDASALVFTRHQLVMYGA